MKNNKLQLLIENILKEFLKENFIDVEKSDDDDDEEGPTRFWGNQGAGILLISRDTKRLFLTYRSVDVEQPHTWGIPGGAVEPGEDPKKSARREAEEETQHPINGELIPAFVFSKGTFKYHNFISVVDEEFDAVLDWENEGSGWFSIDELPSPLHFGATLLLKKSGEQIEEIISNMS